MNMKPLPIPLSTKQVVLDNMTLMALGCPGDVKEGICQNIACMVYQDLSKMYPEGDELQMQSTMAHIFFSRMFRAALATWSKAVRHNNGEASTAYPIPAPDDWVNPYTASEYQSSPRGRASSVFHTSYDKWDGEYGATRVELAGRVERQIKRHLSKNHRSQRASLALKGTP